MELFRNVDRLLRGGFTRAEDLRRGVIEVPVRTLVIAGVLLGALYGLFMGLYGMLRPGDHATWLQMVSTMAKVPLLFLLTLVVTFPSLYVFSALSGSRLGFADTLRMLLIAIAVNLALLASFGPVTAFFTLSTDSYPFMIVLNVLFFAIAGAVGLGFLWRTLDLLFQATTPEENEQEQEQAEEPATESSEATEPKTILRRRSVPQQSRSQRVFMIWLVIYGIVGAQMGWILRPFIGSPDLPFELFRERQSNFFEAFLTSLGKLFGS